jgi:hypothetical protein
MTLIVASVWGGRFGFVTDRRISRGSNVTATSVDEEATKLLVVYCKNSLFAVTYTGVAVAVDTWLDQEIASCLAFKQVGLAMIQPGSFFLSRPLHELLRNLAFNLPIRLRKQPGALAAGLTLAVGGWHLRPRLQPFLCELTLVPSSLQVGGTMSMKWIPVAKHFRAYPSGLWLQAWGDEDPQLETTLRALGSTEGFTHDEVERYIVRAVVDRGFRTRTVGQQCLALQLDPRDRDGHVQFTYYPNTDAEDPHSFLSGWVLTPTSIHSPTRATTLGSQYSACGAYVEGGYSDPNAGLFVRTRIPTSSLRLGGPSVISYQAQKRNDPPT